MYVEGDVRQNEMRRKRRYKNKWLYVCGVNPREVRGLTQDSKERLFLFLLNVLVVLYDT